MKTWQMIKALMDNKKRKAIPLEWCTDENPKAIVDSCGRIVWESDNKPLNLHETVLYSEWEVIEPKPEPVGFMTAINSGKPITSRIANIYSCAPDWILQHGSMLTLKAINGDWYIED